jgi:hypothetical protein
LKRRATLDSTRLRCTTWVAELHDFHLGGQQPLSSVSNQSSRRRSGDNGGSCGCCKLKGFNLERCVECCAPLKEGACSIPRAMQGLTGQLEDKTARATTGVKKCNMLSTAPFLQCCSAPRSHQQQQRSWLDGMWLGGHVHWGAVLQHLSGATGPSWALLLCMHPCRLQAPNH